MRNLLLPEVGDSAVLIEYKDRRLTDQEYEEFCAANSDLRIERASGGEIVLMAPAGGESDHQSAEIILQLGTWTKIDGRGQFFGSTAEFMLPDGSGKSPDAAWVSNEKLSRLTKAERKKFLHLAPEFIVEVMSPSDRLADAQTKMQEWVANGVELGWLIDGDSKTVYVYRPSQPMEKFEGILSLMGTGPIAGCVIEFQDVWAGL